MRHVYGHKHTNRRDRGWVGRGGPACSNMKLALFGDKSARGVILTNDINLMITLKVAKVCGAGLGSSCDILTQYNQLIVSVPPGGRAQSV